MFLSRGGENYIYPKKPLRNENISDPYTRYMIYSMGGTRWLSFLEASFKF